MSDYDSAASEKGKKLRLYAWTVRGCLYSSVLSPHGGGLIGGPKEPHVLSPAITKASGCGHMVRVGAKGGRREGAEFPHKSILGGSAVGSDGTRSNHSLSHTHSVPVGDSGASCLPPQLQMIQG